MLTLRGAHRSFRMTGACSEQPHTQCTQTTEVQVHVHTHGHELRDAHVCFQALGCTHVPPPSRCTLVLRSVVVCALCSHPPRHTHTSSEGCPRVSVCVLIPMEACLGAHKVPLCAETHKGTGVHTLRGRLCVSRPRGPTYAHICSDSQT